MLKNPIAIPIHHSTFVKTVNVTGKYPIKNYRYCTGGKQLSLYFRHMLLVNMTRDLAPLQLSDLQGEIRPICRTSFSTGRKILIRPT